MAPDRWYTGQCIQLGADDRVPEFPSRPECSVSLIAAHLSVYAQFICGILYLIGAFIRPAALIMIINFIAALIIAHIGTTFQQSFDALMMLFGSVFFLFYGSGKISVDDLRQRQK